MPSIWSGMLCCSMLPASPLARLGARALSMILSSLDFAGIALHSCWLSNTGNAWCRRWQRKFRRFDVGVEEIQHPLAGVNPRSVEIDVRASQVTFEQYRFLEALGDRVSRGLVGDHDFSARD